MKAAFTVSFDFDGPAPETVELIELLGCGVSAEVGRDRCLDLIRRVTIKHNASGESSTWELGDDR